MFALDPATKAKIAANLSRVLILESNMRLGRMIGDLLRQLGAQTIIVETSSARAMAAIRDLEPTLIMSAYSGTDLDGISFVKALRHSQFKAKMVPVIMTKAGITSSELLCARNAGVHEIMSLPFAWQDLIKRLKAVYFKPRNWIETKIYTGPDRRRFNSGDFRGQRKRRNEDVSRLYTPVDLAVIRINHHLDSFLTNPLQTIQAIRHEMLTIVSGVKSSQDPRLLGTVGAIVIELKCDNPPFERLRPLCLELMDRLDLAQDLKVAPQAQEDSGAARDELML
jgi:DNA-binding response OmpR family regulator